MMTPDPTTPPPRTRRAGQLYLQVLVAIALGALLGALAPAWGAAMKPWGDAFIKLVRMIIAPVIFLTLVTGIAGVADLRGLGRVAAKAMAYFLFFSTLALVIGLVVGNVIRPGAGMAVDAATLDAGAVKTYVDQAHGTGVVEFLLAIIPDTLVGAFTGPSILPVLLVAVLFGVAISLAGEPARPVLTMLERLNLVVFRLGSRRIGGFPTEVGCDASSLRRAGHA